MSAGRSETYHFNWSLTPISSASKTLGFLPGNLKCSQLADFDGSDMAGIHDAIRKLRDSLDSTSVSGRDTQADSETIARADKNQAGD